MSKVINFPTPEQGVLSAAELNFANEFIGAIELPELSVEHLTAVLSNASKIVFFSGDVEPGESRTIRLAKPKQLIRAAGNQCFTAALLGDIIRLTFDGDYLYDIYVDGAAELIEGLRVEANHNQAVYGAKIEQIGAVIEKAFKQ